MPSRADFLRSVLYFARLGEEGIKRLEKGILEHSYSKGEVFLLEGEPCPGLYLVASGLIRVFKTSLDGREQVLFLAGPGDSFNDVPVVDGGPNPASAAALENSVVYLVPKEVFLSLLRDYPVLNQEIIKAFTARLRHLTGLVEDLSFRRVIGRVAKVLLQFATSQDSPAPVRQLTQQEMAAMVGTARDLVGRALKTLEQEGAIKIEGRRILILKPQKMRDIM